MNNAIIGFLAAFGTMHLLLVFIPLQDTLRAPISVASKWFWCLFLVGLPLIGALVFHARFRSGLYRGQTYEISAAEERARSGTLAPDDRD